MRDPGGRINSRRPADTNQKKDKPSTGAKARNDSKETAGQDDARESAESYLDLSAFSRVGLIKQLKFEGYSEKDPSTPSTPRRPTGTSRRRHQPELPGMSSFSRQGLIDQLIPRVHS